MVGASLACALKDLPLSIAIIESGPVKNQSQDPRMLTLSLSSQRIFSALKIWGELQEHTTPIKNVHVSDRGHFGFCRFNSDEKKLEAFGYTIGAKHITNALTNICLSSHNIDYLSDAKFEMFQAGDEKKTVTIKINDESKTLTSDLIVGADGTQSSLRKALNIDTRQSDYQQTAIVTKVMPAQAHNNTAYERFTDEGPLALLPMANQEMSLVLTVSHDKKESLMSLTDDEFLKHVQQRFGYRLGRFKSVKPRFCFPLKLTDTQEKIHPGCVLIGNASQPLQPVARQGFNLGLRDVAVLAQLISEAMQNKQPIGALSNLKKYQLWRHRDQKNTILITNAMVRLYSNNYLATSLMRNLLLATMNKVPSLQNAFLKQAMVA